MGEILQVCNAYRLDQWRQIIQKCQESGLSNKAYCQQQGISEKTYYYWLRKLRTAAVEKAAPQIMELEPEDGRRGEILEKKSDSLGIVWGINIFSVLEDALQTTAGGFPPETSKISFVCIREGGDRLSRQNVL